MGGERPVIVSSRHGRLSPKQIDDHMIFSIGMTAIAVSFSKVGRRATYGPRSRRCERCELKRSELGVSEYSIPASRTGPQCHASHTARRCPMQQCQIRLRGKCPGHESPQYQSWFSVSTFTDRSRARCLQRRAVWQKTCGSKAQVEWKLHVVPERQRQRNISTLPPLGARDVQLDSAKEAPVMATAVAASDDILRGQMAA